MFSRGKKTEPQPEKKLTQIFLHAAFGKTGNMAFEAHIHSDFDGHADINLSKNSKRQYVAGAKEDLIGYMKDTLQQAQSHKGDLIAIYVQDEEQKSLIEEALGEIKEDYGDIDVLINNRRNLSKYSRPKLEAVTATAQARALQL